jgi:glycosyltransferase involved in cell wall biosynthesis
MLQGRKIAGNYYRSLMTFYGQFAFSVTLLIAAKPAVFFIPFHKVGGSETVHLEIIKCIQQPAFVIFTYNSGGNFQNTFGKLANGLDLSSYPLTHGIWRVIISIINFKSSVTVFGSNSFSFYEILPLFKKKVKKIDLTHALTFPDPGIEETAIKYVPLIDRRVCIMEKLKNDLELLYSQNHINPSYNCRLRVIRNALPQQAFSHILPSERFEKRSIAFIGRDSKEKRLAIFLDLAKRFQAQHSEWTFHVLGPDSIPEAGSNTRFWQPLTDAAKVREWLHKHIGLLVIPSYREGFPMVIVEAMGAGVPVLSVEVGAIHEIINHGENGWLVPLSFSHEETVQLLQNCILNEVSQKEQYERVASNTITTMHKAFSYADFCKAWRDELTYDKE